MTVVVIGLGSMGRRRIRLMQMMANSPEIVGVNRSPERRAAVDRAFKQIREKNYATPYLASGIPIHLIDLFVKLAVIYFV